MKNIFIVSSCKIKHLLVKRLGKGGGTTGGGKSDQRRQKKDKIKELTPNAYPEFFIF
jgi:hypothetical protein